MNTMKNTNFMSTNLPCAWIVSTKDKGRKSIKNGKVYIKNGQEFAIELYNPISETVLASIKINGINASGGGLVIRPAERFYLDCFIEDRKKFTFNTYEVENTPESQKIIEKNGLVEISFFKERKNTLKWAPNTFPNYYNSDNDYWGKTWNGQQPPSSMTYCSSGNDRTNCDITSSYTFSNDDTTSNNVFFSNSNIETGRIEGGNTSDQTFTFVNMNFESYPINTVSYHILPESLRPIETHELKQQFCVECGTKIKEKFNFCPRCGIKI